MITNKNKNTMTIKKIMISMMAIMKSKSYKWILRIMTILKQMIRIMMRTQ